MFRMMKMVFIATAIAGIAPGISFAGTAQAGNKTPKPVWPSLEEAAILMEDAAPSTAPATPGKDRKMLVFIKTTGFVHSSIPYGVQALEIMGRKTGAYSITVSDDIESFRPDSLAEFDAVMMLSNSGEFFTPEAEELEGLSAADRERLVAREAALKESFLNYVAGGKGLAGIHGATACLHDWPEYGRMIGGDFDSHPWRSNDTVAIKLEDLSHPLLAMFHREGLTATGFSITDELYQMKPEPYSRERQRVLLSLDVEKTDMTKKGINRTDGDFGVSWIKDHGKGRVFYCSLGHREEIYWNPVILRHYLAGIQYALGDLEADATPSVEIGS